MLAEKPLYSLYFKFFVGEYMKKLLALILVLSILLCAFISCDSSNGENVLDETDKLTEADSEKNDKGTSEHVCREVIKAEVIDGYLWITYSDNVNAPVNVGRVSADNSEAEAGALGFYLLSDGTYCAFGNNYKELESIDIPAEYNGRAVTEICGRAFEGATKLKNINIPSSIDTIGSLAFSGCSSLQKIKIGDGVQNIDTTIFEGCNSLSAIEVSESNQFYKSVDGVLYDKSGSVLVLYPMGRTEIGFTVGNGVTTINSGAFYGSINLTSVFISNTVKEIGANAFKNCAKLSQAQFDSKYRVCVGKDSFLVSEISITNMAYYLTDKYVGVSWSIHEADPSELMEPVADTVYVLYNANIREKANSKSNNNILAIAPFGAELYRTGKGNKWSKVTYTQDGTSITGYIANDLITTDKSFVNFIEQRNEDGTPVITKINSVYNAIIRVFPLADGYPNSFKVLDSDEFNSSSIVANVQKGTDNVTVVSVSENGVWAYVRCMGYLYNAGNPAGELSIVEGYTLYSNLEISVNGSSNGDIG